MGPCQIDPRLTKQLPRFLSWRPDPEAEKTDAFNQDWSVIKGYANPPWCLIGCCLSQIKRTECQSHTDHSSLEHTALVPNYTGGLPSSFTSQASSSSANRSGLYNEVRGSRTSCMAYLRESFTSQGISGEATHLILSSWRSKTKSNYNSLFAKWASWCHQWNRNPTTGCCQLIVQTGIKIPICELLPLSNLISSFENRWPPDWSTPIGYSNAQRCIQ